MNYWEEQNVWEDEASAAALDTQQPQLPALLPLSGTPEPEAPEPEATLTGTTLREPLREPPELQELQKVRELQEEVVDPLSAVQDKEWEHEENVDSIEHDQDVWDPLAQTAVDSHVEQDKEWEHEENVNSIKHGQDVWDPLAQTAVDSHVEDLINPFGAMQMETLLINVDHEEEAKEDVQEITTALKDPLSVDNSLEDVDYEFENVVDNNQFTFNVQVMEPVKVGDTFGAHVLYKVKTQVILYTEMIDGLFGL